MNVLYHLTILPPEPGCDAVLQDVEALKAHFGGHLFYLNPNARFPLYVPRLAFGFHKLAQIRTLEAQAQIHHFFNPDPFPFPVLRCLRRPIVYSLTGGVTDRGIDRSFFSSLAAITVTDQRSLDRLASWGLGNVLLVQPGIDTARFCFAPPTDTAASAGSVRLMVGSAPWRRAQFAQKGVDALLAAVQQNPRLSLVFLWRGVLSKEMGRRVHAANVGRRVEVLNKRVDVNQVLSTVHGSIALTTDPSIIRPYPHSLLESLAAGKPVLVSKEIPMSDYVERNGCGVVVQSTEPGAILTAVASFVDQYAELQRCALRVGQRDFAQERMLASFRAVYERILAGQEQR